MAFDFKTFGTTQNTATATASSAVAPAKIAGFDFKSFGSTTPVVKMTQPAQPVNTIDTQLSDMPGITGGVASGVYNAAKGLAQLGGSAAYDAFQAVNHPIQSAKMLADFVGGELGGGTTQKLDPLGNFIQSTVGSKGLLGVAQLPGKVAFSAMHPEDKNAIGSKQALGTTVNAALTALSFGTGNVASNAVKVSAEKGLLSPTVAKTLTSVMDSWGSRAVQSGGIMTGFQAGSNLQEGQPVTEGLRQSFFAGVALPTVVKTTGTVINKLTPSLDTSSGAIDLKKAIGFRGNVKEKVQYDNAAPVVYKMLKDNGFKVSDATDPNNLINLDKGVSAEMFKILDERTKRIAQTGQETMVSGDLAAEKIRNLVEPGSVEDLTNPNMRERLDSIAKNFEGKQYTPVDAQKAIVQANNGFSFSDNPAVGAKIKMAISEAFTPELDRIVGGVDKISYDAKGKPIPVKGGTAELNKKWSALKAFKTQLDKKLILEERKATYDLPTRLTGAQIAGKIGEAVGNPMVIPQKIAGAGLEYLANKILGDRNSVNYRIYQAFNKQPVGEAIVGILNKFTKISDLVKLLEQNPLIANVLEKIYGTKDQPVKEGTTQLESSKTTQPQAQKSLSQESKVVSSPNPTTPKPPVNTLSTEALKYKSAEEFVKAQTPVYHGSQVPLKRFSNKKGGAFFTSDYPDATGYAGGLDNVYEGYLNLKNPLVIDAKGAKWDELSTSFGKSTQEIISKANGKGHDGVIFKNIVDNVMDTAGMGESTVSYVYKPQDSFINESQLTDLWNKAHGKMK